MWYLSSVILAFRRLGLENCSKFQTSLGYRIRLWLRKTKELLSYKTIRESSLKNLSIDLGVLVILLIPALVRLRPENYQKFKASPSYIMRPSLKTFVLITLAICVNHLGTLTLRI